MTSTKRAAPMAAEERREMILDAVIPLLFKHGPGVTSRQIADAAGIAEGTIFRVFADKESVVTAAIEKYFDPEPFRDRLRHISGELPLEQKLLEIVRALRERFSGIVRLASLVGDPRDRSTTVNRSVYAEIICDLLAPEAAQLNWPGERVAHMARMLAFASAIPLFNEGTAFDDEELTRMLLYGIAGQPVN